MTDSDRDGVRFQIARLSGLCRYPRTPEALVALIDAGQEFPTVAGLRKFIDDWLREQQNCPAPSVLYAEVRAHWKPQEHVSYRCTICYDTGISFAPFMVTWIGGRQTAQRLTRQQEAEILRRRREAEAGAPTQESLPMIYEGPVLCICKEASCRIAETCRQ